MQCTDRFLKGITSCRTIEAFQGIILFNREAYQVKVEIPVQHACDSKSWLGPFKKPLVSGAL